MNRPRLYFDNAATSFPKPPDVARAMLQYMNEIGASPGRGAYREAITADRVVNRCRELIARLLHAESSSHVIFTLNATDALNTAIKGFVRHHRRTRPGRGLNIVTSTIEHNSIHRPLRALETDGVTVTRVEVDPDIGHVDPEQIASAITSDTRMVALTHASNVTGIIQPIEQVGAITRQHGILLLVDAAQTLGHVPIDVQAQNIDVLGFPGHKGLLGPQGTGGFYIRPGVECDFDTVREGGTGSASERDTHPQLMPDKFESGTLNGPGIAGLAAGVEWILDRTVAELHAHERQLTNMLLHGLLNVHGLRLLGPVSSSERTGLLSFTLDGLEPSDISMILEEQFGILTRSGLHCAPQTHAAYHTLHSGGAVRMSLGPFLTPADVDYAVRALCEIARENPCASSGPKPHHRSPDPRHA